MSLLLRQLSFPGSIALCSLLAAIPAKAQTSNSKVTISADDTVSTQVDRKGNVFEITGGTEAGKNLFHSFREFSVPTGREAFFKNAENINNIISRITGGAVSNIDGLIRANGNANLFLINPAGIVFGKNASLNIGGSFFASTADSLVFPEGEFSAIDISSPPLLSINAPIGLRFRDSSESIINKSRSQVDDELIGRFDTEDLFTVGLQVKPGKTLALLGGDVILDGGNLTANGGRIEIGSVGNNSLVSITPTKQGFVFGYDKVQNFKDISFFPGAIVDTSAETGGEIQLQGRQITLTGDTLASPVLVFSNTVGEGKGGTVTANATEKIELSGDFTAFWTQTDGIGDAGNLKIETPKLIVRDGGFMQSTTTVDRGKAGDIQVKASQLLEINGTTSDQAFNSALVTFTNSTGDAGNLTIDTKRLILKNGGAISTSTFNSGRSGNLTVTASEIEAIGSSASDAFSSSIATQSEGTGDAGNLNIDTDRLTLQDGGFISSATFGGGKGGNVNVNATEFIILNGTIPTADLIRGSSGIFVSAEGGSSGNGGNLHLTTKELIVEKGAKISADTFGKGKAGDVTLNVDRLIIRDGGQIRTSSLRGEDTANPERGSGGNLMIDAVDSIEITETGKIGNIPVKSSLFTQAEGTGNAGNINIFTNNLTVSKGGEINTSAISSGTAGNLLIEANSIELDKGTLNAATIAGKGGNITLQIAKDLTLDNSSLISAEATSNADGGNININSDFIVAFLDRNNDILASAEKGRGGNINITTEAILGIQERQQNPLTNDINASSQFGLNGNISISTPDVNVSQGIIKLPTNVVESNQLVAQTCSRGSKTDKGNNNFTITGRGGLPSLPTNPLTNKTVYIQGKNTVLGTEKQTVTLVENTTSIDSDRIVAAQGMIVNNKGETVLVGYSTVNTNSRYPDSAFQCSR